MMTRTELVYARKLEIRRMDGFVRVTVGDPNIETTFDVYPERDPETFEPTETLGDVAKRLEAKRFRVVVVMEE